MATDKHKKNEGLPKYKRQYCDEVIEMGMQGKSVAEMVDHFDISRQTIDNWAKAHPEFAYAFPMARQYAQAFHEEDAWNSLTDRNFNVHYFMTKMQARFRDDYTIQRKVENAGNPVTIVFSEDDTGLL